jgi:thiol-disulfide isomerase/thioredoxin
MLTRQMMSILLLLFGFRSELVAQGLTLHVGDIPPVLQCSTVIPDFSGSLRWNTLRGKTVILDFWATWCPPCIASIPRLDSMVEEFRNKSVVFYSITYEPATVVTPFLLKHPMKSTVCLDKDFATFRSYKAWGIPMVVIVSKTGTIAAIIHPSRLTADVIRTVVSGKVPKVEQAQGWSDPQGAEKYFRSTISREKK